MNLLTLKFQTLNKASKTLKNAVEKYKKRNNLSKSDLLVIQDSMIKRFEYTFYLTWKYLKTYIQEIYGIEVFSPKKVFLECGLQKITTKKETNLFLNMTDDENTLTNDFNDDIADEISKKIPGYYELMVAVIQRVKP